MSASLLIPLIRGEQLFSITAFPNGSADDSFESQLQAHAVHQIVEERSDSSEDDHCRTSLDESSFDQVAVRKHGHMSSNGSDSIFHSTDESFGRSLSFAIKPLRPISGVSAVSSSSDSGEPNEDDTFAFRRQNIAAPSPKPKIARSPRNQQRQPSKSPSARPMSVVSNTSSVFSGANDTFANTKHRAAPLPFSLPKLTHDKPVARSAVVAAAGVSPLRIKRKAVPLLANVSTESPRKARLVDGSEIERSSAETLKSVKMPTKGMTARPSLEDSCLQAQGEDLSFSSQGQSTITFSPMNFVHLLTQLFPSHRALNDRFEHAQLEHEHQPLSIHCVVPAIDRFEPTSSAVANQDLVEQIPTFDAGFQPCSSRHASDDEPVRVRVVVRAEQPVARSVAPHVLARHRNRQHRRRRPPSSQAARHGPSTAHFWC